MKVLFAFSFTPFPDFAQLKYSIRAQKIPLVFSQVFWATQFFFRSHLLFCVCVDFFSSIILRRESPRIWFLIGSIKVPEYTYKTCAQIRGTPARKAAEFLLDSFGSAFDADTTPIRYLAQQPPVQSIHKYSVVNCIQSYYGGVHMYISFFDQVQNIFWDFYGFLLFTLLIHKESA